MATINKKNMNYRIDFARMTLIMTADFAAKAYDPETPEYEILKRLKKEYDRDLTQEELTEFCNGVDHALYSEVNMEMMQGILDIFNNAL